MVKKTLQQASAVYASPTGSTTNPVVTLPADNRSLQQKCSDSGGFWDAATQSCLRIPPKQPEQKAAESQEKKAADQVFRNEQGKLMASVGHYDSPRSASDPNKSPVIHTDHSADSAEEMEKIKETVNKLAEEPVARRGVSHSSILEKGIKEGQDDDGKTILSVSTQKEEIIKAMEDVIEKSTDESRKDRFSKALLHFNMGGSLPSQDIAKELFLKENIRLVR